MGERVPIVTFTMVCEDCKLAYPCAVNQKITNPDALEEFLFEHYGHALRMLHNESSDQRVMTYRIWRNGTH